MFVFDEECFVDVTWRHAYNGNISFKRGSCESRVRNAEAEDFVEAKVNFRNRQALHLMTRHGSSDRQGNLLEVRFPVAVKR